MIKQGGAYTLTMPQIRELRALLKRRAELREELKGMSYAELGKRFGVSHETVRRVDMNESHFQRKFH